MSDYTIKFNDASYPSNIESKINTELFLFPTIEITMEDNMHDSSFTINLTVENAIRFTKAIKKLIAEVKSEVNNG